MTVKCVNEMTLLNSQSFEWIPKIELGIEHIPAYIFFSLDDILFTADSSPFELLLKKFLIILFTKDAFSWFNRKIKQIMFFWAFYSLKNSEIKCITVHKNIKQHCFH